MLSTGIEVLMRANKIALVFKISLCDDICRS